MLFLPISGDNGKKEEACDASNPGGLRTLNTIEGQLPSYLPYPYSAVIYPFLLKYHVYARPSKGRPANM